MPLLVLDASLERRLKAQRARSGANRYDEVWEGTYVMAPLPNDEHQEIVASLTAIFQLIVGWPGLGFVRPGVNVSDQPIRWKKNYRAPDVVVFLKETQAQNLDTHWLGGPDFLAEIVSRGDRSRKKLPFYSKTGVREALLVDRDPWRLTLFCLTDGRLRPSGESTLEQPHSLASGVLPLSFRLIEGPTRPMIEVTSHDGQTWLA